MSEIGTERNGGMEPSPAHSAMTRFLWQQLPYIIALVLAVAGAAYTNASHQPLIGYWEFLALAIGVVCVINKWPELDGKEARWRLIWTRALHWVAVLVAMDIMLMSGVQQLLPTPATSLVLLTLLELGAFLAGRQPYCLPRPRDGHHGPGDILVAAIHHLLPVGRRPADRPRYHVLASPGAQPSELARQHWKPNGGLNAQPVSRDHLRIRLDVRRRPARARRGVQSRPAHMRQHTTRRAGAWLRAGASLRIHDDTPDQAVHLRRADQAGWSRHRRDQRRKPFLGRLRQEFARRPRYAARELRGRERQCRVRPRSGSECSDRRLSPDDCAPASVGRAIDRIEPCGGSYEPDTRPSRTTIAACPES